MPFAANAILKNGKGEMHMKNNNSHPICITGKNPYGICSCCKSDDIECCASCKDKDNCNIVCGWLDRKEDEKK